MAQFVRLTEEDPTYDLVTLINRLNGAKPVEAKASKGEDEEEEDPEVVAAKASPLGKLVSDKKIVQFLDTGFFKNVDKIFANADLIEPAFSLAFATLSSLETKDQSAIANKFAATLVKDTKSNTQTRLSLLTTLFNFVEKPNTLRHSLLLQILNYAADTKNEALFDGQLGSVDDWVGAWALGGKEKAELYGACFRVGQANKSAQTQHFLYKHLESSEPATFAKAGALVTTAVVEAAKQLDLSRLDQLSRLPAVQAQKGAKHAAYEFLQVFVAGSIKEYNAFVKANADFLKNNGIDADKAANDMKSLTLCTLGLSKPLLGYADLKAALALKSNDEVEECVIEAITAGLLDAQIDQEKESVLVRRSTERQFHDKEWDNIAAKLESWKAAVVHTLNVLAQQDPGVGDD